MKRKTEEFITIKIWKKTLSKLRLIAALKERSMVSILEDMVEKNMPVSVSEKDKRLAPE